mmetsp:Transcript_25026/g.82028  ORF Transcript_25026/g.82028 Transcript_25026/m.82028 type:complete len:282 (+) Transcript_25026:1023-1868(+)
MVVREGLERAGRPFLLDKDGAAVARVRDRQVVRRDDERDGCGAGVRLLCPPPRRGGPGEERGVGAQEGVLQRRHQVGEVVRSEQVGVEPLCAVLRGCRAAVSVEDGEEAVRRREAAIGALELAHRPVLHRVSRALRLVHAVPQAQLAHERAADGVARDGRAKADAGEPSRRHDAGHVLGRRLLGARGRVTRRELHPLQRGLVGLVQRARVELRLAAQPLCVRVERRASHGRRADGDGPVLGRDVHNRGPGQPLIVRRSDVHLAAARQAHLPQSFHSSPPDF